MLTAGAVLLAGLELRAGCGLMRSPDPTFLFGLLSWGLLRWAGFLSFRLAAYPLGPYDLKKVWIRAWPIIAFALFSLATGVGIGLMGAGALPAAMWGLKKNYVESAE